VVLPGKFVNIIKELYNGFECCVLHNGQLTDPFTTVSGVRQGCLLSAIIFLIVLDEVLRRSLDGKRREILWRLTEPLEDLDYADDIVLLSHNFGDMQTKLNDLVGESQKVGLRVNIEKTSSCTADFEVACWKDVCRLLSAIIFLIVLHEV
jgi:hypothetical protein